MCIVLSFDYHVFDVLVLLSDWSNYKNKDRLYIVQCTLRSTWQPAKLLIRSSNDTNLSGYKVHIVFVCGKDVSVISLRAAFCPVYII